MNDVNFCINKKVFVMLTYPFESPYTQTYSALPRVRKPLAILDDAGAGTVNRRF